MTNHGKGVIDGMHTAVRMFLTKQNLLNRCFKPKEIVEELQEHETEVAANRKSDDFKGVYFLLPENLPPVPQPTKRQFNMNIRWSKMFSFDRKTQTYTGRVNICHCEKCISGKLAQYTLVNIVIKMSCL